jgi:N-acetylglucosamine repressor
LKLNNEIGNVQLMQRINRLKVLDYIRHKGPAARPEIARMTGLSPSSITNIVTYLLEKNFVVETGTVESKEVGRKATLIKFNPEALNVISIDIEASFINIALTDLSGKIIKMKEIPLNRLIKDYEILNLIKKEIGIIVAEGKKLTSAEISGIGIAVSGIVEDDERLIMSSSLRWKGLSLKDYFENSFNLPVYVQNNSMTKALWELKTRKEAMEKNIVFLDLAIGVGIINFYEQKINNAVIGEFGHTTVKKDGPLCFCGNHGCLEMVYSVDAVINQCNELLQLGKCEVLAGIMKKKALPLNYQTVIAAYESGDEDVEGVLKECGEYLGIGIANIINIFNPQRIIINGDVLLTCEFIYNTAIAEANSRAFEQFKKDLKYEIVNIGMEEAVKGVSLYVADRLFELSGWDF